MKVHDTSNVKPIPFSPEKNHDCFCPVRVTKDPEERLSDDKDDYESFSCPVISGPSQCQSLACLLSVPTRMNRLFCSRVSAADRFCCKVGFRV